RESATNSAGAKRTSRFIDSQGSHVGSGSHVMKQILLGVSGIRAEMFRGETVQMAEGWATPGKVKFSQCFHHPNVDRKRRLDAVGEEQDAIGDFATHSW